MITTLNEIQKHNPCKDGWEKLLESLGKREADDEPLSLMYILESNGIKDAIWCLRSVEGEDKKIKLFAIACAREVEHLMTDRSIQVLDVADRFANDHATANELIAAVKWAQETVGVDTINSADLASYNTAMCSAYNKASIGTFATYIADDAAIAFIEKERDEALAKQKELFIKFFGEETNDN